MSAYEIVKTETVDMAAEAARLENFELSLVRQECETLRAELQQLKRDHVDEVSALKHRAEADPVEVVLGLLRSVPVLESSLADSTARNEKLNDAVSVLMRENEDLKTSLDSQIAYNEKLAGIVKPLESSAIQAAGQRDAYKADLRALNAELKELRSLNPKKLKEQNKNLQNRNRELVEIDARNKAALRSQGEEVWKADGWSILRFSAPVPFLLIRHAVSGSMRLLYSPDNDAALPPLPSSVYDKSVDLLARFITKGGSK